MGRATGRAGAGQSGRRPAPRPMGEGDLAEHSDDTSDRRFANTLARGLSVLAAFRPEDHKLGNKELAERTGLPKSTVSRLTFTLGRLGYLNQDGRNERYRLGPALLALGNIATASSSFASHVDAPMQALADETCTLAVMSMRDGGDLVLLRTWVPAGAPRRGWLPVGHRMPLLSSSAGHAHLGALDDEAFVRAVLGLSSGGKAAAPAVAARGAARAQLSAQGFVVAAPDQRANPHITAAAVPFFTADYAEPVVFAAGALTRDLDDAQMFGVVGPALRAAADRISARVDDAAAAAAVPAPGEGPQGRSAP